MLCATREFKVPRFLACSRMTLLRMREVQSDSHERAPVLAGMPWLGAYVYIYVLSLIDAGKTPLSSFIAM